MGHKMKKRAALTISVFMALVLAGFSTNAQSAAGGSGVLVARGNGIVVISGSGSVDLVTNGFLMISGDAEVGFFGEEAEGIELQDGKVMYINLDEKVTVSGEDMEITCGGTIIYMHANCSCDVFLVGSGLYREGLKVGLWSSAGVEIGIEALGR